MLEDRNPQSLIRYTLFKLALNVFKLIRCFFLQLFVPGKLGWSHSRICALCGPLAPFQFEDQNLSFLMQTQVSSGPFQVSRHARILPRQEEGDKFVLNARDPKPTRNVVASPLDYIGRYFLCGSKQLPRSDQVLKSRPSRIVGIDPPIGTASRIALFPGI